MKDKNIFIKFKIGNTINWSGNFFKEFKEGWDMEKAIEHLKNNGNRLDFAIDEFKSGMNKIVNIKYEFKTYFYELDNGMEITDNKNISLVFRKPKFYQTALTEIKGNVLDEVYPEEVYPELKGNDKLTMADRMGSEEAKCPDCCNNEWWLLPADSVAVREGGKPYIECLNCGLQTHL
jgi:hypothetical protein